MIAFKKLFKINSFISLLFLITSYIFFPFSISYAIDTSPIIKELQEIEHLNKEKQQDFINPPSSVANEEEGKPKIKETEVPEHIGKVEVTVDKLIFKGNLSISSEKLTKKLESILGHTMTIKSIYHQLDLLSHEYQNNGYLLFHAYLPPQNIRDGILEVGIIEGKIQRIEVTGDTDLAPQIEKMLASLLLRPLFNVHELESSLTKINGLSSLSVTSTLQPLDEPDMPAGSVLLVVEAKRQPNKMMASANNFGSASTSRYQVSFQYDYHGLLSPIDSNHFTLLSSILPLRKSQYLYYAYEHPVGASGLVSSTSIGLGYSQNPRLFGLVNFKSRATSYATMLRYPLLQSRRYMLSLFGAVSSSNNFTSMLNTPIVQERINTVQLGFVGQLADRWKGINSARLSVTHSLPIAGASDGFSRLKSRYNAASNFLTYNLSFNRLQSLTPKTDIFLDTQAQYSHRPLYAGEEIGYGGDRVGRAYSNYTFSGDQGATALIELRYRASPPKDPLQTQLFCFFDYGSIRNIDHLFGNSYSQASSVGLGIRHNYQMTFSSSIYLAFPLDYHSPTSTKPKNARFGFMTQFKW